MKIYDGKSADLQKNQNQKLEIQLSNREQHSIHKLWGKFSQALEHTHKMDINRHILEVRLPQN